MVLHRTCDTFFREEAHAVQKNFAGRLRGDLVVSRKLTKRFGPVLSGRWLFQLWNSGSDDGRAGCQLHAHSAGYANVLPDRAGHYLHA